MYRNVWVSSILENHCLDSKMKAKWWIKYWFTLLLWKNLYQSRTKSILPGLALVLSLGLLFNYYNQTLLYQTPGYNEQIEHIWLVYVILWLYFLDYDEKNQAKKAFKSFYIPNIRLKLLNKPLNQCDFNWFWPMKVSYYFTKILG